MAAPGGRPPTPVEPAIGEVRAGPPPGVTGSRCRPPPPGGREPPPLSGGRGAPPPPGGRGRLDLGGGGTGVRDREAGLGRERAG